MSSEQNKAIRKLADLVDSGLITESEVKPLKPVSDKFAILITPQVIDIINPGQEDDPIALQFVPKKEELIIAPEDDIDPIGDDRHTHVKGVTHRYPDRVLLKLLHVCAVYCRFCLRREKIGPGSEFLSEKERQEAIGYIRSHKEIWEVILSGGDPFVLHPHQIEKSIKELSEIDHVGVIRIHTRVPIVESKKITNDLLKSIKSHKPVYVVVHCNHPREITQEVENACSLFVDNGVPLLSQTALLKGVNNNAEILAELFRKLVSIRVKPYYLHHSDLAAGTSHFRVTIKEGQRIVRDLRGYLSGICQPHYVLDVPGGYGKVPINHSYLSEGDIEGEYIVEDFRGNKHHYPHKLGQS